MTQETTKTTTPTCALLAFLAGAACLACHTPPSTAPSTPPSTPPSPPPSTPEARSAAPDRAGSAVRSGLSLSSPQPAPQASPPPARSSATWQPVADTRDLPVDPNGFPPERSDCPIFASHGVAYRMRDKRLPEVSGLVMASPPSHAFWVHNDSGDSARVLAVDDPGVLLELLLPGVNVIDAEDIALSPGPSGQPWWLYLADIGDNLWQRKGGVLLVRTPEPPIPARAEAAPVRARQVERLRVHYERGPRDAEAFFVDPLRHELVIVTKGRDGTNLVLVAPESAFASGEVTAKVATELHLGLVTAADITRDGTHILLRTYTDAWLWPRTANQRVADALRGPACKLPTADEPQCEAAGFGHDRGSYFTVSEGNDQPVYRFAREP